MSADFRYIAEEIPNASVVVPWIMIATAVLNGVLGFAALIAILFCAGNVANAEMSPTGYPFIEIFYQATNSAGGATAMVCVILALVFFASISLIATASRMTWAFARDNGLPGSNWLSKVCQFPFTNLHYIHRILTDYPYSHRWNLAQLYHFTLLPSR